MGNYHRSQFWQEKILAVWPTEMDTLHTGEILYHLSNNYHQAPSVQQLNGMLSFMPMIQKVGLVRVLDQFTSSGTRTLWSINWEFASP